MKGPRCHTFFAGGCSGSNLKKPLSVLSLFAGRILKRVHEVFALEDLRELIVAEERRDYEDFRELGAYLSIAKRALLAAHIKVGSMYPRTEGRIQDIRRIEDALFEVRGKLDGQWLRDLTEPRPPGPHPGGERITGGDHRDDREPGD